MIKKSKDQETTTSQAYANLNDLGNKLMFQVEKRAEVDKFTKKMFDAHIKGKMTQKDIDEPDMR